MKVIFRMATVMTSFTVAAACRKSVTALCFPAVRVWGHAAIHLKHPKISLVYTPFHIERIRAIIFPSDKCHVMSQMAVVASSTLVQLVCGMYSLQI